MEYSQRNFFLGDMIDWKKKVRSVSSEVFPIMNLMTSIKDGKDREDNIKFIINKYEVLRPVLGEVVVNSDGSLEKGHNDDLIICRGEFNISREDIDRFF